MRAAQGFTGVTEKVHELYSGCGMGGSGGNCAVERVTNFEPGSC